MVEVEDSLVQSTSTGLFEEYSRMEWNTHLAATVFVQLNVIRVPGQLKY